MIRAARRRSKGGSMRGNIDVEWEIAEFPSLTVAKIYEILKSRSEVFVVEQKCVYLDIDGLDRKSLHVVGWGAPSILAAYLRLIPPGEIYEEPALGRILTTARYRGTGLGRKLMEVGIRQAKHRYPGQAIKISAQLYLEKFYRSLGFIKTSEPYDEDGIAHIDMLLPK
jgi:ElaA protein